MHVGCNSNEDTTVIIYKRIEQNIVHLILEYVVALRVGEVFQKCGGFAVYLEYGFTSAATQYPENNKHNSHTHTWRAY